MPVTRGTKGSTYQKDDTGKVWTLQASVLDIKAVDGHMECSLIVTVINTPFWPRDPRNSRQGDYSKPNVVLQWCGVSATPQVGMFVPNDLSVLQSPVAEVPPPPPLEASAVPAPAPRPLAPAPGLRVVPPPGQEAPEPALPPAAAVPPPAGAAPIPAPVGVQPSAAPAAPVAAPTAQAKAVAWGDQVMAKLDAIEGRQIRLERNLGIIVAALRAMDPGLEVLAVVRAAVNAVPPDEQAKEPAWVRGVLAKLRPPPPAPAKVETAPEPEQDEPGLISHYEIPGPPDSLRVRPLTRPPAPEAPIASSATPALLALDVDEGPKADKGS